MIEQSYGRYIRKDFLGPLIAARPKTLRRAAVGEKTGPLTGPPLGVLGKRPKFPREFWWRRGELNRPLDSQPGTKKALDSPRNSGQFGDFPKDGGGPKTAGNGHNNPEKSDPVRSVKCGTKRPKSS